MKRCVCALLMVFGAVAASAQVYDSSPNQNVIIPECIWATATGGGDWVTEVQITASPTVGATTTITASFYYGTGQRTVTLGTLAGYHSLKFSNILETMQSLDGSFTYYGRVGALWLTAGTGDSIWAQARTYNGNYGKTYPGLPWSDGNTVNYDTRSMLVQNLTQNTTYRTFVGCFNALDGEHSITVDFYILDQNNMIVGVKFTKIIPHKNFISFNPFLEAGVEFGTYDNCWLFVQPTASGNTAIDSKGMFVFGSSANNFTNDTYAHIAVQYQ